jgi:CRISPR-associated protein Csb1
MPIDLTALDNAPRLLIEASLRPVQGTRFQPTGFPNLGHAVYDSPDGRGRTVLVESAQSMANRLETVCWDEVADDWVTPLKGLPYVRVEDGDGNHRTNSVLEAHRINSEYIARANGFEKIAAKIGFQKGRPFDVRRQLVPALLEFDINSLIHGVFLEEVAGIIRLPRTLSAFVEAAQATVAPSGGVKFNRVDPTLKEGEGNVPFARDEWVADQITAYFNLDLRQIRAFGFEPDVERLLVLLALFKIGRFLVEGLRLRTACDLDVSAVTVTRPIGFGLPELDEIESELPGLIQTVGSEGLFGESRVLTVKYEK